MKRHLISYTVGQSGSGTFFINLPAQVKELTPENLTKIKNAIIDLHKPNNMNIQICNDVGVVEILFDNPVTSIDSLLGELSKYTYTFPFVEYSTHDGADCYKILNPHTPYAEEKIVLCKVSDGFENAVRQAIEWFIKNTKKEIPLSPVISKTVLNFNDDFGVFVITSTGTYFGSKEVHKDKFEYTVRKEKLDHSVEDVKARFGKGIVWQKQSITSLGLVSVWEDDFNNKIMVRNITV